MSICLISPSRPYGGGIARWTQLILGCFDSLIYIDSSVEKTRGTNRLLHLLKSLVFLRKLSKELLQKIKRNNITVIHICTSGGFGFFRDIKLARVAKKHNIRVVLHFHFGRIPSILKNKKGFEYRLLLKLRKYVSTFISMDPDTQQALKSNCFNNPVYIPNPVLNYENKYDVTSKCIIFIGLISKNKGVNELLSAFDLINKKYYDWELYLVGGKTRSFNLNLINENVKYFGVLEHDDVINLLKKSAFLVLPSYSEGMPNVILESLSCSVPVIATDVGNIREMIHDVGLIIEPQSTISLFNAMEQLIVSNDLRLKLSSKSKNRQIERFSINGVKNSLKRVWFD